MIDIPAPLRLRLDAQALVANWRWLDSQGGGAATGAAVKADGYGLGACEVVARLAHAGCRDFFVATWAEAVALMPLPSGVSLSVLHGVRAADLPLARTLPTKPVLNSVEQVALWRAAGDGRACDVMIDTGMNRLGLRPGEIVGAALTGVNIDTVMSHLASGDEDSAMNAAQLSAFTAVVRTVPAKRYSLANSAGICLGQDYAFNLTRPGLALYGGIPRAEAQGQIRQVATPQAQVLQIRSVPTGESVGYGATWRAPADSRIAIVNLGYADGYWRSFAGLGRATWQNHSLPLAGRVSMDLLAFDVTTAPGLADDDWLEIDYDLPATAQATGMSQYELLTGLGRRFDRVWV